MELSLQQLAETGLLGLLLVIALGVIVFLYRETKKERDARLVDLKENMVANVAFIQEVKTYMENVLSLMRTKK